MSLLFIALLTGCEASLERPDNVPIVLTADLSCMEGNRPETDLSKGVIKPGTKFDVTVAGWENSTKVDYAENEKWYSTTELVANRVSEAIILTPTQVYNSDNNVKTFMKAWHPAVPPLNGEARFDNPEGTIDALFSNEVVGSKNDSKNKVLEFSHKTVQLKFVVVADKSLESGTVVRRITIKDAELPIGFNISASEAIASEPRELDVPDIVPEEIVLTEKNVGEPVMIMPRTGNKIYVDVETMETTFRNVEVTIRDENFIESKAYKIILTFKQKQIGVGVTVDKWSEGSGTGVLE